MAIDNEKLHAIAITYINEEISMKVLAERFHVSKPTIVRALNGQSAAKLDEKTQKQVDETKQIRWIESKKTYGNLGHKKKSSDEAKVLAMQMVEEGLSLEALATEEGPSISTIYNSFTEENLGSELFQSVTEQYETNKRNASIEKNIARK